PGLGAGRSGTAASAGALAQHLDIRCRGRAAVRGMVLPAKLGSSLMRWRSIVLVLTFLAAPGTALAGERYAVIVSGASGGAKYAAQQQTWGDELAIALKDRFIFPEANVVTLSEQSTGTAKSTADNVRRLFGDLRRRLTRDDLLFVVLLGHGTFDGESAKFNLVGPDLTATEWKLLLDGIAGRLVVVNTT